jgi:dTMP kinase
MRSDEEFAADAPNTNPDRLSARSRSLGRSGFFLSFEGIDGVGKSTQVAALAGAIQRTGREVVVVRPSDTVLGELVRGFLLQHQADAPVEPWSEALLFVAQRAQLLREEIIPALERGAVVIADRYVHSTLAYQGAGRGLDIDLLRTLHRVVCHDLWPDLTVLLELDPAAAASRQRAQELPIDRIEQAPKAFHQRVAEMFSRLAQEQPDRFLTVDASRSARAISSEIADRVVAVMQKMPEDVPAASTRVPVA